MKKICTAILLGIVVSLSLHSCVGTKAGRAQRAQDISSSVDKTQGCFVVYKDGTTKKYKTLKLKSRVMQEACLLADGTIKIYVDEMKAYQNEEHYAVKQPGGNRKFSGVECLPGFAIRLVHGKLSVYHRYYSTTNTNSSGPSGFDEYFVQLNDGPVNAFNHRLMRDILKDDPKALEFYNSSKSRTLKRLKETATLFNGTVTTASSAASK